MRKDSSSPNRRPGPGKPFKKDSGSSPRKGDKPSWSKGEDSGKSGDRPARPYGKSSDGGSKRPYSGRDKFSGNTDRDERPFDGDGDKPKRSYGDSSDRPGRSFNKNEDRPKRSFDKNEDRPGRSFNKSEDRPKRSFDKNEDRPKRSFDRNDDRPGRSFNKSEDRPKRSFDKNEDRPKRSFDNNEDRPGRSFSKNEDRPKRPFSKGKPTFTKREDDPFDKPFPLGTRKVSGPFRKQFDKEKNEKGYKGRREEEQAPEVKEMTLNKFISHSGKCSRRDAAELVKQGKVKVNDELALDPGYRVQPYDIVTIAGKKLTPQKGRVYLLVNKPKDYITTTEDPGGRRTVMDLVADGGFERLFPVGRLDRATTGLILLTNDGDLAQKLSHPSYEIKKVYQVTLNKNLTKADFEKIVTGVTLEDGEVKVDALAYLEEKNELGLEIHSGKNRVVRRIFESLGYEVEKLDRVMYAGLTKKNLPRGKWRQLTDKELILLKHFKS